MKFVFFIITLTFLGCSSNRISRATASSDSSEMELRVLSNNSSKRYKNKVPKAITFHSDGLSLTYNQGSHGFSYRYDLAGEVNHDECNVKKMLFKSNTIDSEYILYVEDRSEMNTDLESNKTIYKNGCLDLYKDKKTVVSLTISDKGFSERSQTITLKEK